MSRVRGGGGGVGGEVGTEAGLERESGAGFEQGNDLVTAIYASGRRFGQNPS